MRIVKFHPAAVAPKRAAWIVDIRISIAYAI